MKDPFRLQMAYVRRRHLRHRAEAPPAIVAVVRNPVLAHLLLLQVALLHIDQAGSGPFRRSGYLRFLPMARACSNQQHGRRSRNP